MNREEAHLTHDLIQNGNLGAFRRLEHHTHINNIFNYFEGSLNVQEPLETAEKSCTGCENLDSRHDFNTCHCGVGLVDVNTKTFYCNLFEGI